MFGAQEFRDLQMWSQLAWFDEEFQEHDPRSASWIERGRDFTLADQAAHGRKAARNRAAWCMPEYRKLAASGQIEISTTPYYHPILPLLCDSDIAGVSHPGVPLPAAFPLSAGRPPQLAWRANTATQISAPRRSGCGHRKARSPTRSSPSPPNWASSGPPPTAACSIAPSTARFRWRSCTGLTEWQQAGHRHGRDLPRPLSQRPDRFRLLEDGRRARPRRISCAASARTAAAFLPPAAMPWCPSFSTAKTPGNITTTTAGHSCANSTGASPTIPPCGAVTVSEALRQLAPRTPRSHLSRLLDQRQFRRLDRRRGGQPGVEPVAARPRRPTTPPTNVPERSARLAFEELLIAEGSDWCWWYGPEHDSANREEFDQLYRSHLANVYRFLDLRAARRALAADPAGRRARRADRTLGRDFAGYRRRSDLVLRVDGRGRLPRRRTVRVDARQEVPGEGGSVRFATASTFTCAWISIRATRRSCREWKPS